MRDTPHVEIQRAPRGEGGDRRLGDDETHPGVVPDPVPDEFAAAIRVDCLSLARYRKAST